ncbi:hypothetical protein [Streptomyces sp. NPDC058145]|uniref:hypothetical protein n=1 Tax=Streptomyces sp. NPDC058145 TaxID=3346356 RepID=UPI0036E733AA
MGDRSLSEISRTFQDIAGEGEGAVGSAESTGSTGVTGATGEAEAYPPRSALSDIAEHTVLHADRVPLPPAAVQPQSQSDAFAVANQVVSESVRGIEPALTAAQESAAAQPADRQDVPLSAEQAVRLGAHRRRFRARLGEFRRRRVLVPYGEDDAALTVETQGARWLLAFTDEGSLARYALARGERDRAWRYRAVWGAAVLDAGVPAVAGMGLPCGVLVDAGDGERGLVLPPVVGIVPEAVAVDRPDGVTGSRVLGLPDTDTDTDTDSDSDAGTERLTGEERS